MDLNYNLSHICSLTHDDAVCCFNLLSLPIFLQPFIDCLWESIKAPFAIGIHHKSVSVEIYQLWVNFKSLSLSWIADYCGGSKEMNLCQIDFIAYPHVPLLDRLLHKNKYRTEIFL